MRRITWHCSRRDSGIGVRRDDGVLLGWSDRCAGNGRGLALAGFALDVPKMILERILEVARRAPEISHDLPQIPRKFRQFFRPEHHQNYNEDYDQVWNAEHLGL
jgi:hypothetical protein